MIDADPNWLLATVAQSAAAIVAIVGGFLVSRVVAMSAERSAIRKRHDEVRTRTDILGDQLTLVSRDRQVVCIKWFRDHHMDSVVDAEGDTSLEELLDEWLPLGSERCEMEEPAAAFLDQVNSAFRELDTLGDQGMFPDSVDEVRAAGLPVPGQVEDVYAAVIEFLRESPRSVQRIRSLLRPDSNDEVSRQKDRIRDIARLEAEVDRLQAQLDRLELQTKSTDLPATLYWGVGVLGYIAASSVVFPVALMASRPIADSLTQRLVVVGLFISALVVLLAYLALSIRDLQR